MNIPKPWEPVPKFRQIYTEVRVAGPRQLHSRLQARKILTKPVRVQTGVDLFLLRAGVTWPFLRPRPMSRSTRSAAEGDTRTEEATEGQGIGTVNRVPDTRSYI
eukprot:scaffold86_cov338-Pavlova_lutheri.AAC.43